MPIPEFSVYPTTAMEQDEFDAAGDAWMGELPAFIDGANELEENVEELEASATDAAAAAVAAAAAASASAVTALNAPGTNATSTTSLTIGLGDQVLTIQTGKSIVNGNHISCSATAGPTNLMAGTVTSYNSGTGVLEFTSTFVQGSGTASAWTVSLCAPFQTLASMGAAERGANTTITSLGGLTTPLSELQGGNGFATGAPDAIQPIAAALASDAMTVTLNPTTLDFRSTTLTSGTVNSRSVAAAINVVVPSGATLGTTNAVPAELLVLAIDNAGTVELAIVNVTNGTDYNENGLISTTAIGTGSDSANTIYSTAARTNVAYRVVGFIRSAQVTAGTWATPLTLVQGAGGKSMSGLGVVTGIRKQKFTANGTWTCPAGVTTAYISGIGCGGGGGGSGATYATGGNGTNSTFDALLTLAGGSGGQGGHVSAAALGGASGAGKGFKGGDGSGLTVSGTGGGIGGGLGNATHLADGSDATAGTGAGGGGGGHASGSYVPSAGGGSGEIADYVAVSTVPGTVYTVTIGTPGSGADGGSTTGGNGAAGYFIVEW